MSLLFDRYGAGGGVEGGWREIKGEQDLERDRRAELIINRNVSQINTRAHSVGGLRNSVTEISGTQGQ